MTSLRREPDLQSLLLAHNAWLVRLARHLVRDGDVAAEAVQETWLAALRRPPDPNRPPRPWLAEVLRNVLRSRQREGGRRERREQLVASWTDTDTGADVVERVQLQRQLVTLVLELPEPYRTTVLMRFFDDLEPSEIARRLGEPAGTVRRRLHEGLLRLRARLAEDDRRGARLCLAALAGPGTHPPQTGDAPVWLLASVTAKRLGAAAAVLLIGIVLLWRGLGSPSPEGSPPPPPLGQDDHARQADRSARWATAAADGSLEVQVEAEGGEPVTTADVTVAHVLDDGGWETTAPNVIDGQRPDHTGRATFTGLLRGRYVVSAAAPEHDPASTIVELVGRGNAARITLTLVRGGVGLTGHVREEDGSPVAGAHVALIDVTYRDADGELLVTPTGASRSLRAVTAADGAYRAQLSRGHYLARVTADGYAPTVSDLIVGRDLVEDIVLRPAARIEGRVVNAGGSGVEGADVWIEVEGLEGLGPVTRSEADGHFRFVGIPGGTYQIAARRDADFGSNARLVLPFGQSATGLTVTVSEAGVISGRILDHRGAPLPSARVRVMMAPPPFTRPILVQSGSDGRWQARGLVPGPYEIGVEVEGFAPFVTRGTLLGRAAALPDIVLEVGATLEGRVVDGEGRGVAGASVAVRRRTVYKRFDAGRASEVTTSADGRFRAGSLPTGAIDLVVRTTQGLTRRQPMELGRKRNEVTIRLDDRRVLSGSVRQVSGATVPGARIGVFDGEGRDLLAFDNAGPDGRFRIGDLPARPVIVVAGRHRLVRPPVFGPFQSAVDLSANDASGVDLKLDEGDRSLAGVVVDERGQPIRGATVGCVSAASKRSFLPPEGDSNRNLTITDEGGRFTLTGLDAVTYVVHARAAGYVPREAPPATAGATSDVRIVLQAEAVVAGRVLDRNGAPVSDYTIVAVEAEPPGVRRPIAERWSRIVATAISRPSQVVHDGNGAFRLTALPSGSFGLHVTTADGLVGKADVTLAPGKTSNRDVVVQRGGTISGRVFDYDTKTPAQTVPVLVFSPGVMFELTTDAGGRFRVTGVPYDETVSVISTLQKDASARWFAHLSRDNPQIDLGDVYCIRQSNWIRAYQTGSRAPGFDLESIDGRAIVDVVYPQSRAAAAGILPGEEVLALDGRDLRGLGHGSYQAFLRGPQDSPVAVTLARDGQPTTIVVLRGRPKHP